MNVQCRLGSGVENRTIGCANRRGACRTIGIIDRGRQEIRRCVAAANDRLRLRQRIRVRIDIRPKLPRKARP